jgi:hypothetical protein
MYQRVIFIFYRWTVEDSGIFSFQISGPHTPKHTVTPQNVWIFRSSLDKVVVHGFLLQPHMILISILHNFYPSKKLRSSQVTIIIFLVTRYIPNQRCSSVDAGFGSDVFLCSAAYPTKCLPIQRSVRWQLHHMDRLILRFLLAWASMNLQLSLLCDWSSILWLHVRKHRHLYRTCVWYMLIYFKNSRI